MSIPDVIDWVQNTPVATFMQVSEWAFPAVESLHVIALTVVLGTIAIVDLRLLGVPHTRYPITAVIGDCLRWTWGAFALAVVTGVLMFTTNAQSYYSNLPFRIKMLLLLLAGANMVVFELRTFRTVSAWDQDRVSPLAGKIAGALSLTLWIAIVAFGRWIGFTKVPY
jgi:hypothetical protein